jgi:hypothetical protein
MMLLKDDILSAFFIPFRIMELMISRTPWERDDELSHMKGVYLSESGSTSTSDDEVSIRKDRPEGMWIDPIIERHIAELVESGTLTSIEESEDDDPLYIHSSALVGDCSEDISRSLTSTEDEDMTFVSFPVFELFCWFSEFGM